MQVQASITAAKLEAYWSQMRLAKSDVIGLSLVRDPSSSSQEVASNHFNGCHFYGGVTVRAVS